MSTYEPFSLKPDSQTHRRACLYSNESKRLETSVQASNTSTKLLTAIMSKGELCGSYIVTHANF